MSVLTPLVSVIVPCRNERRYITKCLDSILANDYAADRIEVLVVDGASGDGTRDVLQDYAQRWPQIRWLHNAAGTAPAALNIGIRQARGDIVMRMDAHCQYPDRYISALVGWLERSDADNVGGLWRILPGSDSFVARAIAVALSDPFGAGNAYYRIGTGGPKWVDTVPFGCYRRSVFERIGLFDEELIRDQDDEFNQRLLRFGGRILLVPEVTIDYYARDSIRKVARMHYQYGYFKPLAAWKARRIGTLRQVIPATFLVSLVSTLLLVPWLVTARWALVGILGAYLVALLFSVVRNVPRNGLGVSALLAMVFPAIHFSYAFGSLRGLTYVFVRAVSDSKKVAEIPLSR
jgi:glycosyltransferase involved in cell wall biosynthesis